MSKKIQSFDAYVVYHNGVNNDELQPIFCIGTHFEDKCSSSFSRAKLHWQLSTAEVAAKNYNDEAACNKHCLAGKFKIGRLCVEEMVPAEA